MRTSTLLTSSSQNPQVSISQTQYKINESLPQNLVSTIQQQSKLAPAQTSSALSSFPSSSTQNYLNQFNLLLLSNQLMSFSQDSHLNPQQLLQQSSSQNLINEEYPIFNERDSIEQEEQICEYNGFQNNKIVEGAINKNNMNKIKQLQLQQRVEQEDSNDHSSDSHQANNNNYNEEKNRAFSFNSSNTQSNSDSNVYQSQENYQVTRQQLLLGLMGLEQQLKKLQEESQQRNSLNCSSSTSSNHRNDEEEDLSPVSLKQPQLVSFCNFPSNDADATPIRKRSGRVDSKLYPQLQRQQSSASTQVGLFSNSDILTPSKKVNVVNGGGLTYTHNSLGSDLKNISSLTNINNFNNCLNQFSDLNDFCLDDDEDNPRIETSTMSESKSREFNKVKEIVYFIVNNLDRDEEGLAAKRRFVSEDEQFADKKPSFLFIFDQLVKKFKHLKKTKEEKTKFCMRKAFRYLFAQLKMNCNSKMNLKEANEICMKHYFSKHVNDSQFVLPFRRNSSIKTMNAAFLKKVFSSEKFVQDYREFLNYFDRLALDDNSKKVDQLAYYILPMLEESKFEKINGLRRLPWTMSLLDSTRSLAYQLLDFEENPSAGSQASQQTIQNNLNYSQIETLRESVSIFNSPTLCANNISCQNDENLSNIDTLSIQTQNRKISEPFINVDLISRKQSISSNGSQNNRMNSSDIDSKEFSESSDQHISYLKQINNALLEFQSSWNNHQLLLQKQKSKEVKREVIILSPPLYDLNENPHKKFQFNFCK